MRALSRRVLILLGIGSIMVMSAGCAIGPTRLEADYGKSFSQAKSSQTLDPAAQQNLAPVYGFDGRAAEGTIGRYQTSFEKPPPPPSFVISVGQGS
jgi:hypothetical protein